MNIGYNSHKDIRLNIRVLWTGCLKHRTFEASDDWKQIPFWILLNDSAKICQPACKTLCLFSDLSLHSAFERRKEIQFWVSHTLALNMYLHCLLAECQYGPVLEEYTIQTCFLTRQANSQTRVPPECLTHHTQFVRMCSDACDLNTGC